jgi:hypothetical protein
MNNFGIQSEKLQNPSAFNLKGYTECGREAEMMGISAPMVQREWRAAKAWLHRMLTSGESDES